MKVSQTPTGFIAVKAHTNSDWDSVDFAIVRIDDPAFNAELASRIEASKPLFDIKVFYGVKFAGYVGKWCDDYFAFEALFETDDEDGEIIYLDITDEEYEALKEPEQRLFGGVIRIDADSVQFSITGKNSSDEFWTEDIPFSYFQQDGQVGDVYEVNVAPEQLSPAMTALVAIRARIQGEYDNPTLVKYGALHADTDRDILRIIDSVFD